jgi:pimeloyl-ACP methyl ester carboxylesterase
MKTPKIHIYFIPGLAASSKIFEFLNFSEDKFELHYLEWILPLSRDESIQEYAKRMSELIIEKNVVLVGVSFGGIMVQEISKHVGVKKIILISSIKCNAEFPQRLKFIQKTKAYLLFPAKSISTLETLSELAFGEFAKKRIDLYKKYLSVRDEKYLAWAIKHVLSWKQETPLKNTVHIHGSEDHIFPIKHINNCIPVKNGTHIMVLNKANTISKIVSELF